MIMLYSIDSYEITSHYLWIKLNPVSHPIERSFQIDFNWNDLMLPDCKIITQIERIK